MLPNVTQRFGLQRPNLESCGDEAMLNLFIAEHCSTVWKHPTIWKRSSRNVCHTKKRSKLQLRCSKSQNVDWKKIVAEKFVGQDQDFQSMLIERECKTKN